jgi:hypothetical protein
MYDCFSTSPDLSLLSDSKVGGREDRYAHRRILPLFINLQLPSLTLIWIAVKK